MTLLAFQQAYATLISDAETRERFLADPQGVLMEHPALDGSDRALLTALREEDLTLLATVLDRDRRATLREHAPWTLQGLGERGAAQVVRAYTRAFPSCEETGLRETGRFLRWMKPRKRRPREGAALWLASAIAYERTVVRLQLAPEREDSLATLGHNPCTSPTAVSLDLPWDLSPLTGGGAPLPQRSGYVLYRAPRSRAVRAYRVAPWMARLLQLADGTRDLAMLTRCASEEGVATAAVLDALAEFRQAGLLAWPDAPAPTPAPRTGAQGPRAPRDLASARTDPRAA